MIIRGRVWKFGNHVDTDLIIPARFLNNPDPQVFSKHCFADERPEFARNVKEGDIVVAGVNFGCGSSREHAPLALKTLGIRAVIASSFARIFYRNAFNIGLPLIQCAEAHEKLSDGANVSLDLEHGIIETNNGLKLHTETIPDFMMELIMAGGLVEYIKNKGRRS